MDFLVVNGKFHHCSLADLPGIAIVVVPITLELGFLQSHVRALYYFPSRSEFLEIGTGPKENLVSHGQENIRNWILCNKSFSIKNLLIDNRRNF